MTMVHWEQMASGPKNLRIFEEGPNKLHFTHIEDGNNKLLKSIKYNLCYYMTMKLSNRKQPIAYSTAIGPQKMQQRWVSRKT